MRIYDLLANKKVTVKINRAMEMFLPPALSDRKFVACLLNFLQGRGFTYIDPTKDPSAFPRGKRDSDCTPAQWRTALELVAGTSVLDIGCGSGSFVRLLASKGFRATGLDPWGTPEEGKNWRIRRGYVEDFNLPEKSFDTVLSFKTLEHIPDPRSTLAFWRTLAKRRILLVLPCQRYRRFVYDGHVNFFPDEFQLRNQLGLDNDAKIKIIDNEWLVYEDIF